MIWPGRAHGTSTTQTSSGNQVEHEETQIWTKVSCLGLTSDLYGSESLGLNYPITCTWASQSYGVSKPLLNHQHNFNVPGAVFFPLMSKPEVDKLLKDEIVNSLGLQDIWSLLGSVIVVQSHMMPEEWAWLCSSKTLFTKERRKKEEEQKANQIFCWPLF